MTERDSTDSPIHVQHEPERSRYVAIVDGTEAVVEYRHDGHVTAFVHTEVPARIEGRGVASALARRALDDARAGGDRVIPACAFFARYMDEHPEYDDLRVARAGAD